MHGDHEDSQVIIPAIMAEDFSGVLEKINLVSGFAKEVQIDVMDGKYVPSKSWPYVHESDFEELSTGSIKLPEHIKCEAHLMVSKPSEVGIKLIKNGIRKISIHADALSKEDVSGFWQVLKEEGLLRGAVTLNLDSPVSSIGEHVLYIEGVQLMGIRGVGYQGQTFDGAVIGKINEVRSVYPDIQITIDGGVSMENIKDLSDAGADRFVVGSSIFGKESPKDAYFELLHTVTN